MQPEFQKYQVFRKSYFIDHIFIECNIFDDLLLSFANVCTMSIMNNVVMICTSNDVNVT